MALRTMTFEGQPVGTTMSNANSDDFGDAAATNTSAGTGGTLTFSSTQVMHGTRSLAFSCGTTTVQQFDQADTASAVGATSFYLYLTAYPSVAATQFPVAIRSSAAAIGRLEMSTTGQIRVSMVATGTYGTALALNTWYRVEVQCTGIGTAASAMSYQVYAGDTTGTPFASGSVTGQTTSAQFDRFRYSKFAAAPNGSISGYFDTIRQNIGSATPLGPATTSVPSDSDLRWRVSGRINSDLDARWQVIGPVTSDLDVRWKVGYSQVTSDLDARWAVLKDTSGLNNNAEGGVSGDSVTVATSGLADGEAFSVVSAGTGGTIQWQTSAAMHGNLGYLFTQPNSANPCLVELRDTIEGPHGRFSASCYFKTASLPSATVQGPMQLRSNADAALCRIQMTTTGGLQISATATSATTANLAINTAYRIEWYGDGLGTTIGNQTLDVYVGDSTGTPYARVTLVGTANTAAMADRCRWGKIAGGATWGPLSIDDLYYNPGSNVPFGPAVTKVNFDHNFQWAISNEQVLPYTVLQIPSRVGPPDLTANKFLIGKARRMTTTVTSDVDFRWAVRSSITSDLDLRWPVRTLVNSDLNLPFLVIERILSDLNLPWSVRNSLTSNSDLRWAVRSSVTSDVDLRWAVRSRVNSDVDLRWPVRTLVSSDLDARWRVRVFINSDADVRWIVGDVSNGEGTIANLLASYNFDEASGTYIDVSGNGNTLTLTGASRTASGAGHTEKAITSNAGAIVTFLEPAIGQTTNRTVMFWAKGGAGLTNWWIRWNVDSIASGAWGFVSLSGDICVQARNASTLVRAQFATPVDNLYHHFAATYVEATGTVALYIDGVVRATNTITGPLRTDANRIDWEAPVSFFMDDLRIFNTALTATQIGDMAGTPVGSGGGTTTEVNSDIEARWTVKGAVASDLDGRWRVIGRVTSDLDARWSVRSGVLTDLDLRWATKAFVLTDLDLQWRCRQQVTSDADARWRVRTAVTSDLDARWVVRSRVTSDVDAQWRVSQRATSDLDARWGVTTTVTSDLDLRWPVSTTIDSDLDARWDVSESLVSDVNLLWEVDGTVFFVSLDTNLFWGQYEQVVSDADLRWVTRNADQVASSLDARWGVRSTVTSDVSINWIIDNATAVSSSLDTQWRVRTIVTSDLDARWGFTSATLSDLDARWAVRARVEDSTALLWRVAGRMNSDVTVRWTVRNETRNVQFVSSLGEQNRIVIHLAEQE